MRQVRALLAIALAACAHCALAASVAAYQPQQQVQGEIRIWGSPDDRGLIALWESGFRKRQPGAHIIAQLHGPESALAGIYTGVADIAFIGRELREPVDNMAFQWVKLYRPSTVAVANAGLHAQRVAAGLAVFVHRDNPIAGLTVAQLDGIFGAEHKRGSTNLRTWGDLGLEGAWRDRPIHVYAPPVDSVAALYFRKVVLDDSFKWNAGLTEVSDPVQLLDALARDPAAIAYAPMAAATGEVRAVPVAASNGGPFVALTEHSAVDHSYPLKRVVILAFDRAPDKPLAAPVREFLRYVLSAQGQADVARDAAYLPLTAGDAQAQLQRLE